MRHLVFVVALASCQSPTPPATRVELQHVGDPEVVAAVSEAITALEARLADTPVAADRVRLRIETIESLRPLVKPSGARALAEIRNLVLSCAAFEQDVALADREVQP